MEDFKRFPINEKKIADINEDDIRVAFIGEVLDRSPNRMVVGNSGQEIEVVYDEIDVPGSKKVRVIGTVSKPLHIKAEAIQNISSLDQELYERARSLFKDL